MPDVALENLLGTATVTRAISRIKTPMQRLQFWWGMNIGGPAENVVGGINTSWDIMDYTRTIANARAPGAGPGNTSPQKIGQRAAIMARFHEKIHLQESKLFRTRPLGGNYGLIDNRGQRYVTRQENYLAQRFSNAREYMVSRIFRGGFYLKQVGDDWVPVDSSVGAMFQVDYGIPSGHFAQLNVDGGGDLITNAWATTSTDILGEILAVNAKMEEMHGFPLRHIWCDSGTWEYALNNSGFQTVGGSSNQVFTQFAPSGFTNAEGIEDTGFVGTLRALPWLQWHIYDAGLDVDGSFAKMIEPNKAAFMPDPTPDIAEYHSGSEVVAENVMDTGSERFGFSAWTTRVIDPAGFEMKALDIGLPVVYIPKAILYGTVA